MTQSMASDMQDSPLPIPVLLPHQLDGLVLLANISKSANKDGGEEEDRTCLVLSPSPPAPAAIESEESERADVCH